MGKDREAALALVARLHEAQRAMTRAVLETVQFEDLDKVSPEGFSVRDHLRMWVWHAWSHHRDLVRARGCIEGDNPHFHIPHFVRQANEEFGRLIGELACMTDEQLDLRPPDGERSVREVIEHVLATMTDYFPAQLKAACAPEDPPT